MKYPLQPNLSAKRTARKLGLRVPRAFCAPAAGYLKLDIKEKYMAAYVYLIEEEAYPGENSGPWTKIGYSQNPPEWRMDANLKRGNPRNIRVAAAFEYDTNEAARAAERGAHQQFGDLRHQKEWFRVAWSDVAAWLDDSGARRRFVDPGNDA